MNETLRNLFNQMKDNFDNFLISVQNLIEELDESDSSVANEIRAFIETPLADEIADEIDTINDELFSEETDSDDQETTIEMESWDTSSEAAKFELSFDKFCKENGMYFDDIFVTGDNTFKVDVTILTGDWKHDHLRIEYLMSEFCKYHHYTILYHNEQVLEDSEDDSYSAIHRWKIGKEA